MRTDPELAARVFAALPGLAEHRCRNDADRPFAEEAADTEVAHLFEHVWLEILLRAGAATGLDGETTWDFARDGRGVFAVTVDCGDPRTCRRSAILARRILTDALAGRALTDPAPGIERIGRAVRARDARAV
jgi:hypothetical protein